MKTIVLNALHKITVPIRKIYMAGDNVYCPICSKGYRAFYPYGVIPRPGVLCPGCGSLERHRLLWVALEHAGLLPNAKGKRMLHVAPEPCLTSKFKGSFEYISIDLKDPRASMKMDITQLCFPDEHFDAIVCNHVLEHVPADAKALSELYRVLKRGGWASIQVPMMGDVTQEDLSIQDPKGRERLYGQPDHVRSYGRDFLHRLERAGFKVDVMPKIQLSDEASLLRISVDCEEEVWVCGKV